MGELQLIQKTKLVKYFYRLSEENQELIIFEMIDLYRKQPVYNNTLLKKTQKKNYTLIGKIIFVDFKK
jgi:hypothetical protein